MTLPLPLLDVAPADTHPVTRPGDTWTIDAGRRRRGLVQLHCADALAVEWGGAPDLVFSDPPFGMGRFTKAPGTAGRLRGVLAGPPTDHGALAGDASAELAERAAAHFLAQWPEAVQVWWGANLYRAGPPSTGWIVWDKTGGGRVVNDNADCEMAWTNRAGPTRLVSHLWRGMVRDSEHGERRQHPTQKPVALARWVIEAWPKMRGSPFRPMVVYEPFAGVAPAMVVAYDRGLIYRGAELDHGYVDAAVARLLRWRPGAVATNQRGEDFVALRRGRMRE